MIFKLGELFCGPGGLAWGATHADIGNPDFRIVHEWANDYDANTCQTYRNNICPDRPESVYHADVRKFDLTKLSPIDAFAFGFPCNDYSVVGEQKGMDGVYGPLYSYGVKVLKLYRPQWFLAENVGGLKNANDGKAFTKILEEMRSAGYKLYPNLYKFETYGIPQARHRIIIVGIRNDLDFEFKIPSNAPYKDVDNSCKSAIEVPPIPADAENNELTKQSTTVVERLKYIKPGQNAFTADLPENLQLPQLPRPYSQGPGRPLSQLLHIPAGGQGQISNPNHPITKLSGTGACPFFCHCTTGGRKRERAFFFLFFTFFS